MHQNVLFGWFGTLQTIKPDKWNPLVPFISTINLKLFTRTEAIVTRHHYSPDYSE